MLMERMQLHTHLCSVTKSKQKIAIVCIVALQSTPLKTPEAYSERNVLGVLCTTGEG